MPGWGQSPRFKQELTIENYAIYVKSLIDQLKIPKITYAGHCMGASLGVELGVKIPEKLEQIFLISTPNLGDTFYHKLLLFAADTSIKFPKPVRPLFYLWRNRLFGATVNIFVIRVIGKMRKLKLIWHYIVVQGKPDEQSIEEAWKDMIHFDFSKIKDIKVPVHLIHGNEDLLIPKKRVNEVLSFLPTATIDYVLDSGHMPPVENSKGVAEAILRY
jgi:pimeloyl-ACP methyl ester carboxylesterase